MFLIHRPGERVIREVVASQEGAAFSYPEVGATRVEAPAGYQVHRERFALGSGPGTFERAKQALRKWRMFEMGWLELCWPDAPVVSGSTVAVLARHLGFWSLHVARIVYVVDESRKYGFAYGTLAEHAESGEEWFGVEQRKDNSVVRGTGVFAREARAGENRLPVHTVVTAQIPARFGNGHAKGRGDWRLNQAPWM
jgi:uncharacterized protein (UPF0548 family)